MGFLEERPNSEWALKQAAILEINSNNKLELSIEKLQKLLRLKSILYEKKGAVILGDTEKSELSALWLFLSEAYKQMGNLQSAVRACITVLDYKPENFTALFQVNYFFVF